MPNSISMELIAFDIGNSNFHFGSLVDGLLATFDFPNRFPKKSGSEISSDLVSDLRSAIAGKFTEKEKCRDWVGVSVDQQALAALKQTVKRLFPNDRFHQVTAAEIPIRSQQVDLTRTGVDRLLTSWYAGEVYGLPVITVDVGSAVTIDWANQQGEFQGGMIFPGAKLSAASLRANTDALPQIELNDPLAIVESVYGRETVGAIQAGIFWSQWGGICHAVKRLQQIESNQSQVILTGGGMRTFETLIPDDWRYDPELNLKAIFCLALELGISK